MGDERGVTAVEWGLLVAVIAVVCLGALKLLGDSSSESFDEVAVATGSSGGSSSGGGGGGSGGGGSSGGGGGGGGSPTSTTSPSTSTTAAPTTTTVAPTTTTSAPATTTTTLPPLGPGYPSTSGFAAADVQTSGGSWRAETSLVIRAEDGTPLPGTTATVRIWRRERRGNGWRWESSTVQVTTGANGAVDLDSGSWPRWGGDRVSQVHFELLGTNHPDWDGEEHSVSANL